MPTTTANIERLAPDDLLRWFERRVEASQPEIVVAISRAAPRILEAMYGYGNLGAAGVPVISDVAISFLDKEYFRNRRVLIIDDCVNYGSSMDRVKSRLLKIGLSEEQVSCAAYAVDKEVFLGRGRDSTSGNCAEAPSPHKKSLKVDFEHALPHGLMPSFHNFIVETVRKLAKPYNLDFPIFVASLAGDGVRANDLEWRYRLKKWLPECDVYSISTKVTYPDSVSVFSIPIYGLEWPEALRARRGSLESEHYSKIRIYIDRKNLRAHLAPMFVPRWKAPNVHPTDGNGYVSGVWNMAARAVGVPSLGFEPQGAREGQRTEVRDFQNDAVYELIIFLNSLIAFHLVWTKVLLRAWDGFFEEPGVRLSLPDSFLLLGPELSSSVTAKLSDHSALPGLQSIDVGQDFQVACTWEHDSDGSDRHAPGRSRIENVKLYGEYRSKLRTVGLKLALALSRRLSAEENLSRLLFALRLVVDEDRRVTDVGAARLRQGFTFRDMFTILNRRGSKVSIPQLSLLLDCFIDLGIIVPVVMNLRKTWVRAYRSGEAVDAINKLKIVLDAGLRQLEESGSGHLSPLDLSKIFVVLHEMFPTDVNITPEHDVYGIVATVNGQRIEEWGRDLRLLQLVSPPTRFPGAEASAREA